jgi:hypothetical protein
LVWAAPILLPLSRNWTVAPAPGLGDIVAVRVTDWPGAAGFGDTVSDNVDTLETVSVTAAEELEA